MDPRESHGRTRRQLSSQTYKTSSQSCTPTSFQQHSSHSIKYNVFWFQCHGVCLWGQWGSDQNDYQRLHNEACFKDPQNWASTSQVRLKDAYLGGFMEKQRRIPSHQEEEDSEDSDNPEAETWYCKAELVAQNSKAWEQPLAHGASSSVDKEGQKGYSSDMGPLPPHIAEHISFFGNRLLHGQENLWKTTWRSCGRFACECGCLANVHEYHSSSSGSSRKRPWHEVTLREEPSLGQLFYETRRLISEQSRIMGPRTPEIVGLKTIEFEETTWRSTSLLCERAYQITDAEVYILSDSLLCAGEMGDDPNAAWKDKIHGIRKTINSRNWIASTVRVENLGFMTLGILGEIQKLMKSIQCEPEHFNGRIIFMSMYNDTARWENGNTEECVQNSFQVSKYARRFPWDLDQKRNGTRLVLVNRKEIGTELQEWWYFN